MHTLIVTGIGLLVLLATALASSLNGWAPGRSLLAYLAAWLLATLVHGAYGIHVGESIATEVQVFLLVYGVPAALAGGLYWAASRA